MTTTREREQATREETYLAAVATVLAGDVDNYQAVVLPAAALRMLAFGVLYGEAKREEHTRNATAYQRHAYDRAYEITLRRAYTDPDGVKVTAEEQVEELERRAMALIEGDAYDEADNLWWKRFAPLCTCVDRAALDAHRRVCPRGEAIRNRYRVDR